MAYWRYTPAGHLIRLARQTAGMSQQELALAADVTPGRVSDYERGKIDPSFNMLLRLLSAADMSVSLVDADSAELVNPEHNGRVLEDVLSLVDALPSGKD